MYDSDYTHEIIMRNRTEELNRKLERMAGNYSFPASNRPRKRIVNWMSMILLSFKGASEK